MLTAITTILGALPLVLSQGAGASGRHSIGGSVMGGMMSASFLAIFFIPLFFVVVSRLFGSRGGRPPQNPGPDAGTPPEGARHDA